jgi:hypothetical protein
MGYHHAAHANLFDWLTTQHTYQAIWGHYLATAGFLTAWFGRFKSIPSKVSVRGTDFDRAMYDQIGNFLGKLKVHGTSFAASEASPWPPVSCWPL